MTRSFAAALLMLFAAGQAVAQGTLSTQGLGFPPGQMSTQARTMGGATAEADPLSALNPAALGLLTTAIVLMQSEPEYRRVTIGGQSQRSSVARFPLFLGGLPLGRSWTLGLAASTLLDRTWETTTRDTQFIGNDTIASSFTERSDGSITDLRIATAYAPATWMRIGLGLHAFTGRDVIDFVRTFDDTLRFATDASRRTLGFGGNAFSVGIQTLWTRRAAVGVSYRKGGYLRTYSGDSIVSRGDAPDHFGASIVYLGMRGSTLAIRAAHDKWTNVSGLSSSLNVRDSWDIGAGADVNGPSMGAGPLVVRVGGRWRNLPFSADDNPVKERTWSGGIGFPLARGRAEFNLGLLNASRTSSIGASESSWTLSTGFFVRP